VRQVLADGRRVVAVGVVVGVVSASQASRLLADLVFEVDPGHPGTLLAIGAALFTIAALACYVPAARAARLEAVVALKAP
jgi:hypothetical protein